MTDEELAQELHDAAELAWVALGTQRRPTAFRDAPPTVIAQMLAVARRAREMLLPLGIADDRVDLARLVDMLIGLTPEECRAGNPTTAQRDAAVAMICDLKRRTGGTESDSDRHWHKDGSSDTDPRCHRARVMFPKDMPADNKALTPGETCMLKSGSPEMTVVEILADGNIRCDFFSDLAGDFRTYDFAAVALRGTK